MVHTSVFGVCPLIKFWERGGIPVLFVTCGKLFSDILRSNVKRAVKLFFDSLVSASLCGFVCVPDTLDVNT